MLLNQVYNGQRSGAEIIHWETKPKQRQCAVTCRLAQSVRTLTTDKDHAAPQGWWKGFLQLGRPAGSVDRTSHWGKSNWCCWQIITGFCATKAVPPRQPTHCQPGRTSPVRHPCTGQANELKSWIRPVSLGQGKLTHWDFPKASTRQTHANLPPGLTWSHTLSGRGWTPRPGPSLSAHPAAPPIWDGCPQHAWPTRHHSPSSARHTAPDAPLCSWARGLAEGEERKSSRVINLNRVSAK